jgi:neutral trehalase
LEGVEIVCRRRPHVGEEDSEEEMERKVQKKEDTNEEKMFLTTRPRNVKKINLTSEVKTQNKYDPLSDHEDTDLVECRMDEGEVEEVPQTEELKKEKTSPIILHGNFGAKKLLEFCKHGTKNQGAYHRLR